jgi:rhodanese-related sulfurtransferase
MEHLVVFITKHWLLSSLLLLVLLAFSIHEWFQSRKAAREVSSEQTVDLMNHQDAVVIDIRSESQFQEGHILDSLSIPSQNLDKKMNSLQKYQSKPIIVVCNVGQAAAKVALDLKQKGFPQVFVLSGGLQAWKGAGLPLVKKG